MILIVKPVVHKLTCVDLRLIESRDFQFFGDALVGLIKPGLVCGMHPEDTAVLLFESMSILDSDLRFPVK